MNAEALKTTLDTLLQRWRLMMPRERRVLVGGAALLVLVLAYLVLVEPAWRGRQRLQGELPALRAQLAQLEQLSGEARRLGAVPAGVDSAQALKVQLERSIVAAGLRPALAQFDQTGTLFDLRFRNVPYAPWLAWLDGATRETRLRVVDAAITREVGTGAVSVKLALEMPRRDTR